MKTTVKNFILLGSLFITIITFGCASSTMIRSIPSGAKVYVNNELIGETPCKYEDIKIVGSRTFIKLKKEGHKELNASFQRDEEFSEGACIGGLIVFVPFLWVMEYKPERFYELEKIDIEKKIMDEKKPLPRTK